MYTRGRPGHAVHPFLCYICPEKELLDTSSRLSVPVSFWIVVVAMPYHCLFFFFKKNIFPIPVCIISLIIVALLLPLIGHLPCFKQQPTMAGLFSFLSASVVFV